MPFVRYLKDTLPKRSLPDPEQQRPRVCEDVRLCAPGRIRTSDRLLKRELLYQLSYGRIVEIDE